MDEHLQQVRDFADKAHGDQLRKYAPERYIAHPIRVMQTCEHYGGSKTMLAAALLHDVLEDTHVSLEEMQGFLANTFDKSEARAITGIVVELTDVYVKKNFPEWNRRKRKQKEMERLQLISPQAQTIKYADIIDNATDVVTCDPEFARTMLEEYHQLLKRIDKGDDGLYKLAKHTVHNAQQQLQGNS
jgi:(p)ppGpp synthase/HD superfamily hydrolase